MRLSPGNDLDLGLLPGRNARLRLSRTERDKHLYVCGGTGTGKSKFLEHLIRQDIVAWSKSKCGLLLLDPHGNLYDNLMRWLAWNRIDRPIVPIDLRQDDWVVSYNLLRQRTSDPAVLVDNITDAMAYVWGQGGTDQTPLFARWAGNVLRTLYEKKMTLVECEHLIDRVSKQMRYMIAEKTALKHEKTRLQRTGTTSWFEPMMGLINTLELAGKAEEAKSPDEIAPLVQRTGLNLLISRKKVSFDLAPPFDFASEFLAETRISFNSRPAPQIALLGTRTIWCSGQDLNLHALRQRLLRPSCMPIPPPER